VKAILAGALLGIALAGCGGGSHHARPHAVTSRAQAKAVVTPHPQAAVIALGSRLSAQLKAAGRSSGAIVYDLTAGRELFSLRPTVGRPPASVEKLYTTVAVLSELGPDARLQTTVLGTGQLAAGVWKGDLYLRGGGDPTFGDGTFNQVWEDGYGPTALQLSNQLRRIGIRHVTGRVIGDASLFDALPGAPNTGYRPDVPDIGGELAALTYDHGAASKRLTPGAFAAKELVLTMRSDGIHARAARFTARTPAGARVLASVDSPPMSVLLKLMDVPSDDFFAEMLTKQLGVRFGSAGTTVAGAAVIRSAVAGLGVEPAIVDGSGLSRQDRSSPEQVVDLLRAVWRTRLGQVLRASLPVVGVSGSASRIGVHTAASGRCLAKTGTLDYVSNLAGYCHSREGHTLAFALFVDGPSNSRAFVLIGKMVAAIARY
jgi:D-alanyl-D-alanine carboxypeptidase/D-alanyl-D-alanine-endopeptidase (penicillin-binding protein 4)